MPERERGIFSPADLPEKARVVWFKKRKPFLVLHH